MERNGKHGVRAVLFVEDDPGIRTSAGLLLRDRCVVMTAGSLEEAMAALDDVQGLAALVTDFDLMAGDADGLAVAKAVRARFPDTPILVVTGTRMESGRLQALLSLPATRLLEKPFGTDALLEAVEDLLSASA